MEKIQEFIITLINSLINPNNNNLQLKSINLKSKFPQIGMDSLQIAAFEYKVC